MKITWLRSLIVAVAIGFSSICAALDVNEAKQNGWIGEKDNGYLGLISVQPGVQALVDEVNQKRQQIYLDLAAKNNISLQQVEKLAAQKAYAKTAEGHFIWLNGAWVKK